MNRSKPDPLKNQDQHEPDRPDKANKPDYSNSRPLDIHRWSEAPEVDSAITHLIEEFKAGGAIHRVTSELRICLKMVVLDLYYSSIYTPGKFLAYYRDHGFKYLPRYNRLSITQKPLLRGIGGLIESGYIQPQPGYYNRVTGKGYVSRMRADKKLIKLLRNQFLITTDMIGRVKGEEIIILKDEDKHWIDYTDTPETETMRTNLATYNAFLARSDISLLPMIIHGERIEGRVLGEGDLIDCAESLITVFSRTAVDIMGGGGRMPSKASIVI